MYLIYFVGICVLFLLYFIPSVLISLLIKNFFKRKLSKGWCILISSILFFLCLFIETKIIGIHKPSFWDFSIRILALSIVFPILYDSTIPSIFDTEEELKRKYKSKNNL